MKYNTINILLGCVLSIGSASAANVIVNGSFESTATAIVPDTVSAAWGDIAAADGLTGWTLSATGNLGLAAGDGFGTDPNGPGAPYFLGNTGSQLLGTDGDTFVGTTVADKTTQLTQAISGLSAGTVNVSYDVGLLVFTGADFVNLRFELFDGGDATAASLYDVNTDVSTVTDETFVTLTSGDLSSTNTDLFVRITLADVGSNQAIIGLDNVIVDHEPVPEPSSTALLGLGGLALILRRRR